MVKKISFYSLIVAITIIAIATFVVIFVAKPNESNAECKFWGDKESWIEEEYEVCDEVETGEWWEWWDVEEKCEIKYRWVAILEYACIEEGGEWGEDEIKGETTFGGCGDCGSCNDSRYRWCVSTYYGDGTCADYTCDCRPDLCNGDDGGSPSPPPGNNCNPNEFDAGNCQRCYADGSGWSGACTDWGDGSDVGAWCSCELNCTGTNNNPACVGSPPPPPPPPPPGDFNLSQGAVACNSVGLSWTAASGADGYKILRGSPRVDISPYQTYTALNFTDTTVSQNFTYLYQIEAYNSGGTNRSNEINVTTPYCQPTVNLSANPTSIYQGQASTLSWSSAYADYCSASGNWSGPKALSGSEVVIPSPPPSATYNLTCFGPAGGSASDSVTINIMPLFFPNWREIIPR